MSKPRRVGRYGPTIIGAAVVLWASAVVVGLGAVSTPASAQAGGCVANGSGTAWTLEQPGLGSTSGGVAVGAPGANVVELGIDGQTGRTSTNGLPAGTSLEFFAGTPIPAGQPFVVHVTTSAPVANGAFMVVPINAGQTGYLDGISCAIRAAAPVNPAPASPSPVAPVVPESTPKEPTPKEPTTTATSEDSGGSSLAWLWATLAGVGVVIIGGGVFVLTRKDPEPDAFDGIIAGLGELAPSNSVTVETLTEQFDALEDELADAVEHALDDLAAFEQAYAALWADAMAHLDNYARNYKPLIPQMKQIWDEFADRDWAMAKAEFAQKIVDGVQLATGAVGAVKGGVAALSAAETAYAAGVGGELAAIKVGEGLMAAKSGAPVVVLSGKPVGQAAAKLAALRRSPTLAFEFAAAKGANAVVKTATNTAAQNEKWIRSWLRKLGVANASGNCNCQLATKAGSEMVAKGTARVPFYLNEAGWDWAEGKGFVFNDSGIAATAGNPIIPTTFADLDRALAARPHGTQFWILIEQGDSGHIYNGVRLNGTNFYFDVQVSSLSKNPAKVAAAAGYTKPTVFMVDATKAAF